MTTILSNTEMSTCILRQSLPETYHYKSILHFPLKKPQQELKKKMKLQYRLRKALILCK
jgi:hypothetical protein